MADDPYASFASPIQQQSNDDPYASFASPITSQQQQAPDTGQKAGAFWSSTPGRFLQGAGQTLTGPVQLGSHALGFGTDTMDDLVKRQEAFYQQSRKEAGIKPGEWDYAAGAGELAPALLVPELGIASKAGLAADTIGGIAARSAIGGAGWGASQPVKNVTPENGYWGQKATDTATGALVGGGAGAGIGAAAKVAKPALEAGVQKFIDLGGKPTIGQTLQGPFRRVEEGFKSVPLAGEAVQWAEQRANNSFNRVAANDILDGVGPKGANLSVDPAAKTAQEFKADVLGKLKTEYADVQSQATLAKSPELTTALDGLDARAKRTLRPDDYATYQQEIQNIFQDRFDHATANLPNGVLNGSAIQDLNSDLGLAIKDYARDINSRSDKKIGGLLVDAKKALDTAIEKQNPADIASRWKAVNGAWAKYTRYRKAMGSIGAQKMEGEFTPAQLGSASVAGAGAEQRATMNAPLQDIATMGKQVLGKNLADSGTAYRGLENAAMIGAHVILPKLLIPTAIAHAVYSPAGQYLLRQAIAGAPQSRQAIRDILEKYGPSAAGRLPILSNNNQ